MSVPEATDATTIGGILTGLVALPYVAYKVWQQVKSDQKGDTLDARVDTFTTKLQAALDKVVARADALQVERDKLARDNADLAARMQIAEAEVLRLREELGKTVSIRDSETSNSADESGAVAP